MQADKVRIDMDIKRYTKFIVAIGAALGVVGLALADGSVDSAEVWQIVLAIGGALGVYAAPNKPAM